MVGLIACSAFLEQVRLSMHGRRVAVVGYGLVGEGVADAVRAFGGAVTVVERDPARALRAQFAGWPVASLDAALSQSRCGHHSDGSKAHHRTAEIEQLRNGCFLINVGHANQEFDLPALFRIRTSRCCRI